MVLNFIIIVLISFLLIFSTLKLYPAFLIPSIIISLLSGLFLFFYKKYIRLINLKMILSIFLGIIIGYLVSIFILNISNPLLSQLPSIILPYLKTGFQLFIIYVAFLSIYNNFGKKLAFSSSTGKSIKDQEETQENYKILDTSVIIDGRIADISETGFLEGILKFGLNEL